MCWLEPDNPFLGSTQKERLDHRGVIPVGAVLQERDVLASALRASTRNDLPAQTGKCRARDYSWETPCKWLGARVIKAHILSRSELSKKDSPTVYQRVQIAVHAERQLAVGDVLSWQGQTVGVDG